MFIPAFVLCSMDLHAIANGQLLLVHNGHYLPVCDACRRGNPTAPFTAYPLRPIYLLADGSPALARASALAL
jgi:hypothetical protein